MHQQSTLRDRHEAVIAYLKAGKFVEGIEDFYADNATAQENSGPIVRGRLEMAANERRFQKKLTGFHGIEVRNRAFDDRGGGTGTVFYEATMRWEQSDRAGVVTVDQAVVEQWNNGKITSIRFYGNYEPGPLPE